MLRSILIGLDTVDMRRRNITESTTASSRLPVHDPITDKLQGNREVSVGKVVALRDLVVIARTGSGIEDSFHHASHTQSRESDRQFCADRELVFNAAFGLA
jgi:hypothetical protein